MGKIVVWYQNCWVSPEQMSSLLQEMELELKFLQPMSRNKNEIRHQILYQETVQSFIESNFRDENLLARQGSPHSMSSTRGSYIYQIEQMLYNCYVDTGGNPNQIFNSTGNSQLFGYRRIFIMNALLRSHFQHLKMNQLIFNLLGMTVNN